MKMRKRKKLIRYRPLVQLTLALEHYVYFKGLSSLEREALVGKILRKQLKDV